MYFTCESLAFHALSRCIFIDFTMHEKKFSTHVTTFWILVQVLDKDIPRVDSGKEREVLSLFVDSVFKNWGQWVNTANPFLSKKTISMSDISCAEWVENQSMNNSKEFVHLLSRRIKKEVLPRKIIPKKKSHPKKRWTTRRMKNMLWNRLERVLEKSQEDKLKEPDSSSQMTLLYFANAMVSSLE